MKPSRAAGASADAAGRQVRSFSGGGGGGGWSADARAAGYATAGEVVSDAGGG